MYHLFNDPIFSHLNDFNPFLNIEIPKERTDKSITSNILDFEVTYAMKYHIQIIKELVCI